MFTLWGSGTDIGGTKDAFRYVYQPMSGDGAVKTALLSHSAFGSCAKAGIMIREHLALGSPHIMLGISPADGVFLQTRHSNFNVTRLVKKLRASPPYSFRLERRQDTFSAYISHIQDNSNKDTQQDNSWQPIANVTGLKLAYDVYVGLAVTSCDPAVVSVAKFGNVSLTGGVGNGFYRMDEYPAKPRLLHQIQ